MKKTSLVLCGLLLAIPMAARAQSDNKRQSQAKPTIVMGIRMVEADDEVAGPGLEMRVRDQKQLDSLITEGRVRLVAEVELTAAVSRPATAHIGQRVPIQTASMPVAVRQEARNPSDRDQRDQTAPAAFAFGVPQIQYQNTGVSISATPSRTDDGKISVALSLTLSDFDASPGSLTPVFVNRDLNSTIIVGDGETATVLNALRRDGLAAAPQQPGRTPGHRGTRFMILLSVHSVD